MANLTRKPRLKTGIPSSLTLLRQRELSNTGRSYKISSKVGFAEPAIAAYSRLCAFWHEGCVNTANWSEDGRLLVTGSDDRHLKVWDVFCGPHVVGRKPVHVVRTQHMNNIFCAKFQPSSNNSILYSCSAEGTLQKHNLETGVSAFDSAFDMPSMGPFSNMMHMFHFKNNTPEVMYCAMDDGALVILDTRVRYDNSPPPHLHLGSSVKYIAQPKSHIDTTSLLVGVGNCEVQLYDVRLLSRRDLAIPIKLYLPRSFPDAQCHHLSLCGLDFSSDGSKFLVSYQGDQVYEFDVNGEESMETLDGYVHPQKRFGGHVNSRTFLKTVSYFGPNDEFVLSGSDSGHVFAWKTHDSSLAALLRADEDTCNGAIPHPYLPMFVSYGINDVARLWWYDQQSDRVSRENILEIPTPRQSEFDDTDVIAEVTERALGFVHERSVTNGRSGARFGREVYDLRNFVQNCQHVRREHDKWNRQRVLRAWAACIPESVGEAGKAAGWQISPTPSLPNDYEWSDHQRMSMLGKEIGNAHFKRQRYQLAGFEYKKAVRYAYFARYLHGKQALDKIIRHSDAPPHGPTGDPLVDMFQFGYDEEDGFSDEYDDDSYDDDDYSDDDHDCNCRRHTFAAPKLAWDYAHGSVNDLFMYLQANYHTCYCAQQCVCREIQELLLSLYNNMAACSLALQRYKEAIGEATVVIQWSNQDPKAFFRRGCAYLEINDLDKAISDLNAAHALAPTDANIQRKIAQIKRVQAARHEKQRKAMARMFDSSEEKR